MAKKTRVCSFCGKTEDVVLMMIQGNNGVCACNECITGMYDTIVDYENEGKSRVLYPAGLSISDPAGRRKLSLELSATHDDSKAFYYNVAEDGTVSLTYTLVAGVYADNSIMRYDVPFTAEKGKWNKVTMTTATVTGQ